MMNEVMIEGGNAWAVQRAGGACHVGHHAVTLRALGPWQWEVTVGARTYIADVLGYDPEGPAVRLRLAGKEITCRLRTREAHYLRLIGQEGAKSRKVSELKAPMPGLIRQVLAAAGQEVAAGDPLLVLEAMKMENILKAPAAGVVAEVLVSEGVAVEKNAALVRFA